MAERWAPFNAERVGVGSPAWLLLNQFGGMVWDAFGTPPYLVGSAAKGKQWRDVDVRLILYDELYWNLFDCGGRNNIAGWMNPRWSLLCAAISKLGRDLTGLPIDFQVQTQTEAIAYLGEVRVPLGLSNAREQDPACLQRCSLGDAAGRPARCTASRGTAPVVATAAGVGIP